MKTLLNKTKNALNINAFFRGVERIRTAVDGVADHCLATRPRHLFGTTNLRNLSF